MCTSRYWNLILETMNQIVNQEMNAIEAAAQRCAGVIAEGGVLHVFGTAHSAAQVTETFYRAGGLACVNALLEPSLSVQSGALWSTWTERQPGLARLILDRYDLRAGEPMLIFSVSGVNDVPVDVATESRARGLPVIAITSRGYCRAIAEERGLPRTLLTEADLVIDNHVPSGDAALSLPNGEFRAASTSTIAASFVYHLVLERILEQLEARGVAAPIFASANLPGSQAHNAALVARYRNRIRHL
jgi:uncharacterized phosphosugar-binding protein